MCIPYIKIILTLVPGAPGSRLSLGRQPGAGAAKGSLFAPAAPFPCARVFRRSIETRPPPHLLPLSCFRVVNRTKATCGDHERIL